MLAKGYQRCSVVKVAHHTCIPLSIFGEHVHSYRESEVKEEGHRVNRRVGGWVGRVDDHIVSYSGSQSAHASEGVGRLLV